LLLAAFPSRPGFELSIQGFSPTGDSFSRLKSRPVALSRAKKNFAYRTHRQMVELFRTKQRQKKPSRTTAFQSTPDSSAQRKAKINDCLQRLPVAACTALIKISNLVATFHAVLRLPDVMQRLLLLWNSWRLKENRLYPPNFPTP